MAKNRDLSKLANRLTVDNNYNVGVSGSLSVTGSIISTVSTLWSGSGQLPSGVVSGSAQTIANLPSGTVSGSAQVDVMSTTNIARLATTGSNTFQGNQTINGNLVVTGSLTAQQFIVSSSVTYLTESFASGSHKFGDSSDDTHQFTGSLLLTGSLTTSGSIRSTGTMVMASPFMFRNKIHNGDMRIDQRYAGGAITNTNASRPVDRYIIYNTVGSSWSTQRSTTAPPGFSHSLLATSTTGGSMATGNYGGIRHQIEGINTYDLAWGTASAKNITVSFWVRSSVTGTYGFTIRNGNTNNYGYVSAYTISSANTWTYTTFNIPGPTAGTWAMDELPSLNCIWDLGAGTIYSQAAGSWTSASEILGLTGGVKFFSNSSATYYLTGVQLEVGDVATPFECLPYDVQLRQCQRYFQKWGNGVMFQAGQLGQAGGAYDYFKMLGGGVFGGGEMRTTPDISYDTSTYWIGVGTAGTGTIGDAGTIPSSQYASPQSLHITKSGIGRLGIGDFNTFSPTPVRGRWYVPNSDFVWVSAEI